MNPSVFIIPPPSANRCYRTFRGRTVATKHYTDWKEHVGPDLLKALGTHPGPVGIALTLHGGKGVTVASDLDNFLKPTVDAMREAEVIPDDNLTVVTSYRLNYKPYEGKAKNRPFAEIEVSLYEVSE